MGAYEKSRSHKKITAGTLLSRFMALLFYVFESPGTHKKSSRIKSLYSPTSCNNLVESGDKEELLEESRPLSTFFYYEKIETLMKTTKILLTL